MALIKRNIWSLFYIILLIGVIILGATIFNIYKDTKAYHASKQESFVNVNATAIYSTFLQYEMLLDILGDQLTQNNNYESFEKSRTILDNLLKLESPITAFGLAKPNGQLYVTSSNLKNIKKLPNLMGKKETKESFKYSLDKDFMVIGRTYFHNTLNSLIIPIRKAIKNKDGQTIAVMTAGINVNKAFNLPDSVIIFRDLDYYNQIIAKYKTAEFKNKYQKPLPSSYVEGIFEKVEKNYKRNINYFKNKEEIFSSEYKKFRENTTVLSSIKYINRYKLWVIQQKDSDTITKQIVEKSLLYTVLFIILFSILYYIFKLINDFEKQKNDALYHQATHDYLTNLHNRLYLSNRFEYLNEKTDSEFSLLFIDMDNFKSINDNYGHDYGDLILEEISERLLKFKTSNEEIIRYSGDEFIFITFTKQRSTLKKLAKDIVHSLSQPYMIEQYQFMLGASIGIARFPYDGRNIDEVKRYADIAMYEAKKEKNTYVIFEKALKNKYLRTSIIEHELKSAIENDEIYMVYQPQVSNDGSLYGVEALVRWENRKLGFVSPDEFIKVTEDSGLMLKLGEFIIKQSFIEIKDIQDITKTNFQLSLNISVKQFMEPLFYDKLFGFINKLNFNKLQVTLEVTENVFIEDLDFILDLLSKLKNEQIKISLDDFGTGYSSLNLLKRLPIDELKIDKSFVDDILYDKDAESMIESIISIGKKFGLVILAEGIEEKDQKDKLDSLECDIYQGYYYSKPLKKEDLKTYLENNYASKA